jgi:hypothetical protein
MMFLAQLPEFPPLEDIDAPVPVQTIPWWVWAVIAVLAGIGLIALTLSGRKKKEPELSPREKALRHLARIRREIESLAPREAAVRISDFLRTYLHEEHRLPATTQTTDEFLAAAALPGALPPDLTRLLEAFLRRADEAKFAPGAGDGTIRSHLLEEADAVIRGGTS